MPPPRCPATNSNPQPGLTLLTIVGEHARVEGTLEIADSIQIECEIGGELNVGGRLIIGDRGVVRANVHTVDAIVRGQYEGNMVATASAEITATGQVSGNIETDSLVIAKGGFFNGNVRKSRKSEPEKRPAHLVDENGAGSQK